ncbi:hypothetical protein ANCCEY_08226 [Ancylostoma ceylanicum]|uniref:Activator of basal transcription 1 n=1 Tax=Ancylostoma ceylanicum TaxID=53326 RepID=A0A0D6LN87_9BILA|nr:hypothetical protein ANCCEY_08226 [Ancylostoma ceylanicum]
MVADKLRGSTEKIRKKKKIVKKKAKLHRCSIESPSIQVADTDATDSSDRLVPMADESQSMGDFELDDDEDEPGDIELKQRNRNKNAKTIENRFTEGWLEVKRKKVAKALASRFDNTPVGGKKRDYTSSVLWNIKYLSSFKWVHLMEQLQYERAVSAHHMSAEIAQAKRVAAHFEEQVEKGRHLRKLEEKALKANGVWNKFQREIEQRKVLKPKRKKLKSSQAHSAAKDDDVLQMIFAE